MEIEIATAVSVISVLVAIVLGYVGTVRQSSSDKVEMIKEFHGVADAIRADSESRSEKLQKNVNRRMDKIDTALIGFNDIADKRHAEINAQLNEANKSLASLQLTQQFNKGYLDNYIDERVSERLQEASK